MSASSLSMWLKSAPVFAAIPSRNAVGDGGAGSGVVGSNIGGVGCASGSVDIVSDESGVGLFFNGSIGIDCSRWFLEVSIRKIKGDIDLHNMFWILAGSVLRVLRETLLTFVL